MVEGAIILLVGLSIGYIVQERRIKALQKKLEGAKEAIDIMKEIEKENRAEPNNFYDV